MTSLTEVYDGRVRAVAGLRRLYAGGSLFLVGAAMVVASIVVATTGLGAAFGLGVFEAREVAGVLAGLGLPAAFLGVFTVLPSGETTRAAAVIGASVTVFGVALFVVAYPYDWFASADPTLAVATVLVYSAGALTTLLCMFVALATFKTREDPGGTARMEITEEGHVRLVEAERSGSGFGSVGMFGQDPDGEVSTQTNREDPPDGDDDTLVTDRASAQERSTDHPGPTPRGGSGPTADGGSAAVGGQAPDPDAEFLEAAEQRGSPDAYCGNCEHFEYVKTDGDITPYCGLHEDLLSDMEACDAWESNS